METGEAILKEVAAEAEKLGGIFGGIWEKMKGYFPTLIFALVVLIVGLVFSKLLVTIIIKGMKSANIDKTARSFLKSLLEIVCYILVGVITLSLLGVPMTSIIAVIGAMGLAIGLALQNSMSNIAGGFVILFSRPFKAGDVIEASGVTGKVESITILHTHLTTPDNKSVYIPNGKVSSEKLINFTQKPERRLDLEIQISRESDLEKVKTFTAKIVAQHPHTLKDPVHVVRIGGYTENAAVVHIRVWVETPNYLAVQYDLLEAIKTGFDKMGVDMPNQYIKIMNND